MGESNNHVALFPFMAQGHFIPFISLAKSLAAEGLTLTLLTTTANTPVLNAYAVGLDIRFVSLTLPPIDGLPAGSENTDVLPPMQAAQLICSSHKLSAAFEQWLEQTPQKPLCIISDLFLCHWVPNSASKLGIPCVAFHTTGAFGTSVLQYLFTNPNDEIIGDGDIIEIRDGFLNLNLRGIEVPRMLKRDSRFSPSPAMVAAFQKMYAVAKRSCAAVVVNTLEPMEGRYVRYLEESTGKPVWPLASDPHLHPWAHEGDSDCLRWLDRQKPRSVLYISFGTQVSLSQEQIEALAKGIQGSGQPFIWTIKDKSGSNLNSCGFFTEGFIDATRERGIVKQGWVPQKLILSHPSTGYFMSHCGWNSTVESICAGIPMLVWGLVWDQLLNARVVVDHLRIGLRVCEGPAAIPSSDFVEKTVKAAMCGEIGKEIREMAARLRESISVASCKAAAEAFVAHLLKNET